MKGLCLCSADVSIVIIGAIGTTSNTILSNVTGRMYNNLKGIPDSLGRLSVQSYISYTNSLSSNLCLW